MLISSLKKEKLRIVQSKEIHKLWWWQAFKDEGNSSRAPITFLIDSSTDMLINVSMSVFERGILCRWNCTAEKHGDHNPKTQPQLLSSFLAWRCPPDQNVMNFNFDEIENVTWEHCKKCIDLSIFYQILKFQRVFIDVWIASSMQKDLTFQIEIFL